MTSPATAGAPSPPDSRPTTPTRSRSRLVSLDVVRGVALAGILFVNIPPMLGLAEYSPGTTAANPIRAGLDLLVQQRFFPIFSLLFGIGCGLMWTSAQRAARPRVVMLRRLLFLLGLGILHTMLQPGEALLIYAIAGLVFALPLTWARPHVRLWIGIVVVPLSFLLGGGMMLAAALIVLGFGLAAGPYDVPHLMDTRPDLARRVALIAWPLGLLGIGAQWATRATDPYDDLQIIIAFIVSAAAGFVLAVAYIATVLILLHTRLREALIRAFAPLGRMALTNYLSATLIVMSLKPWAGDLWLDSTTRGFVMVLVLAVVILVAQSLLSAWWLRLRGQGPLEWLWREVTWWGGR
ncbi:DUF418 domain-containing protein [Ornithinimicrobium sp. Y1847]|uniref:DUF418 domain-containing protein n=1 Tax=Ornithinimicrobium sp. Y1847 TaxID=3405419 RepID=UPI003B6826B7